MAKLYHFTTIDHARAILSGGINPSPLAIPRGGQTPSVVSLTTERDPSSMLGKSVTDGSPLSDELAALYCQQNGLVFHRGMSILTADTRAARVEVIVPRTDANLQQFTLQCALRLGFSDRDAYFDFLGQGGGSARTWWIYFGALPAAYVKEARVGDGYAERL